MVTSIYLFSRSSAVASSLSFQLISDLDTRQLSLANLLQPISPLQNWSPSVIPLHCAQYIFLYLKRSSDKNILHPLFSTGKYRLHREYKMIFCELFLWIHHAFTRPIQRYIVCGDGSQMTRWSSLPPNPWNEQKFTLGSHCLAQLPWVEKADFSPFEASKVYFISGFCVHKSIIYSILFAVRVTYYFHLLRLPSIVYTLFCGEQNTSKWGHFGIQKWQHFLLHHSFPPHPEKRAQINQLQAGKFWHYLFG